MPGGTVRSRQVANARLNPMRFEDSIDVRPQFSPATPALSALEGLGSRAPSFSFSEETNPLRRSGGFEGAEDLPSPFEMGQARDTAQRGLLERGQTEHTQALDALNSVYGSPRTVRRLGQDFATTEGAPTLATERFQREAPERVGGMQEITEDAIQRFTGTQIPLEQLRSRNLAERDKAAHTRALDVQNLRNVGSERGRMIGEAGKLVAKSPRAAEDRFGMLQKLVGGSGFEQSDELQQRVIDALTREGIEFDDQSLQDILNDPGSLRQLGIVQ